MSRKERLTISVKLDGRACAKHADAIREITDDDLPTLDNDDTFDVSYSVNIEYLGRVADRLRAFESILADRASVIDADTRELNYGHSLINEILTTIDRIKGQK